MDPVTGCAKFIGSRADVVSNVFFDVQVLNDQRGLVRGALYLIFLASAVDDRLRVIFKQQVSYTKSDTNSKTGVTILPNLI